ncbi:nose resistant to fluoxetine protein 6 [Trichonephila clavata]|uniref:Nose resistant to fluoxetine protein 6 n=1 Tax=Trichonephila clavata TaxID=2740835 RepID=A0A8X6K5T5_TRICU|nr:nose resistant to fluoxetine protein 6 [Trichonephila clavata]
MKPIRDFANSETTQETSAHQRYDFGKLIQNFANRIEKSKNLTWFSEEKRTLSKDTDFVISHLNEILEEFHIQRDSNKCFEDWNYFLENLKSDWGVRMLDSYGKPESGILNGNLKWFGEYEECINVFVPHKTYSNKGGFHGKYCILEIPVKLKNESLSFDVGLCLPDSCHSSESFFNSSKNLNLTDYIKSGEYIDSVLNVTKLTCQNATQEFTKGALAMICLIMLFIFSLVIGSLCTFHTYFIKKYEIRKFHFESNDLKKLVVDCGDIETGTLKTENTSLGIVSSYFEKCKLFFNCFCPFTNGAILMDTSNGEGHLLCLHGIRCLSMIWIILCHNYVFSFNAIRNPAETFKFMDNWYYQIILNGFFSVDSFFLLSGFLVARLFFEKCAGNEKISWIYFYIHRYVRLTPVYMIVIGFYTTLYAHLSSGPLWIYADTDPNCQASWWYNLLYINNFQTVTALCMGWSWYLANDMQFFVISPLLLIPLLRWPKIGYLLIGVFFCIIFGSNFFITYKYNLSAGLGTIVEQSANVTDFLSRWTDYFDLLYMKPHTRMGPYLVGIVLAYYIYKSQKDSRKLSLIELTVGWVFTSATALFCLFGLYHRHLTIIETAFYNAVSRTAFGCCLAWVIFVCINGQGGIVNSILSWKCFIPFSKLTFCAYLIHPIVETAYFSSLRRMFEFSGISMIIMSCGFLTFSFAAAFVVSLLFESPVIRLDKLIRNKFRS